MFVGRTYPLKEILLWTRREILVLLFIAIIPTILYDLLGWKWLIIPWVPVSLVGIAVAFIIGFKNNASYDRTWEARRAWGSLVNASRAWGIMVRDYISNGQAADVIPESELQSIHRRLIYRHLAWLNTLRYQLREPRSWESLEIESNKEYRQFYPVPEWEKPWEEEVSGFLGEEEFRRIGKARNRATQLINFQSADVRRLSDIGLVDRYRQVDLERVLVEFYNQQGVCERIKNTPYPRQFATLNQIFVKIFILMLPFGMLGEFCKLGNHLVWLNVPFSALVLWIFWSLERIGEATENPFEGSPNDVPMAALCKTVEIDLKEMLEETDLPSPIQPVHKILM